MPAVTGITLALVLGCLALFALDLGGLDLAVYAIAALAAFSLYVALLGLRRASVFLRAALALLPIGLLVWVGVDRVMAWNDGQETAELRAIIAGAVVAAGWVAAFITGEMRRVDQEIERRGDIIRAVMSEIDLIVEFSRKADWAQSKEEAEANFFKDQRFVPFVIYKHQYGTLRRLVDQIEILEKNQIRPVLDAFQLLDRLDQIQERMQSETFAKLEWERRRSIFLRYLTLNEELTDVGSKALNALEDKPFHGVLRKWL